MVISVKRIGLLLVLSVLAAGAARAEPEAGTESWHEGEVTSVVGSIHFRECELESLERSRRVECAVLEVPENYQALADDGRTIELFIARLKSSSAQPEPDPLLAIAGGPGQSASQSFLFLDRVFSNVSRNRDIYLVDQRGTGRSNPQHCDLDDEQALLLEPSPEEIRAAAEECLRQFDGDPRQYTTSVAIRDFERVREALGLVRWNLFGISYGTRVAQHYMRNYPVTIRSAVLDSVAYPELNLGPDIPIQSQKALDRLLRRCQQDPACNEEFPELDQGLAELLDSLDEAPRPVVYESTRSGRDEEVQFTRGHLLGLIRMYLYSSEQTSILPPLLHAAYADDNFSALARSAMSVVEEMDKMLAMGMHNSVICTEDVPFYDPAEIDREPIKATYMGDLIPQTLEETCEVWPEGVLDEEFKAPLESDIPTLMFSGEFDPITPPSYAEKAIQGLTSARHFVVPGQGHSVSMRGCAPVMTARFIDEASTENLEGDCLERQSAAPLFIDFNGPSP